MKKACIENNAVREICDGDPTLLFSPEVAAFFNTDVGDDVKIGGVLTNGKWEVPLPPAPAQPPPVPPAPPDPTEHLIDIGPLFDRFGAKLMPILSSADATVAALVMSIQVRKWIDLKRSDVAAGLDLLITKNLLTADEKTAILNTPVTAEENRALKKLYF